MSATTPGRKPTVKQQRAEQRAKKLEAYKRKQARQKRNRRIGIGAAIVGALAVVGVIITSVVLIPQPANYTAGGSGADVEGVQTFENTSLHVDGTVDYPQNPPAGGEHNPAWLNCGVYSEQVPSENAVHSMEHGAVWVTYDPSLADDELSALRAQLPSTYIILSPFEGLPSPIVLSGWNTQLQVESADDERIAEYLEEYWRSDLVPEPGALCTGGVDGPGRES